MIEQKFDKEQNILFVTNNGRLDYETMKTYFSSLKNNAHLTQELFVLEDARGVNVKFTSEHLSRLSNILCKVAKSYNNVHHAVILDDSKNMAYAMMINEGTGNTNYFLKVFSNEKLAFDWVKNK